MPEIQLLQPKWKLAARTIPVLIVVAILKIAANKLGWEFLTLNGVFSAFISANIFLIGFNISGVLADFKAGEKLPGELAAHIEAIADECVYASKGSGKEAARAGFIYCVDFNDSILAWLYRKIKTKIVLEKINGFTDVFYALDRTGKVSSVNRLKHEQSEIRKAVMRMHTIREVRFSEAAYAIAEIISGVIIFAMIFLQINPFGESLFCAIFVAFIFIYMLLLIRDLDDPFAYYDRKHSVEEISLHSLEDLSERLAHRRKQLD